MELKETIESLKSKIGEVASKENMEKVGQGVKELKTAEGRKIAVEKFRNLPTKKKVIGVCLACLLIFVSFMVVSCVGSAVFGGGGVKCKKVANETLVLTTVPTFDVEKGVGYPYLGMGFKVLQWLPDEESAIAVLDWDGHMGFYGAAIQACAMMAGGELGIVGGCLALDELKNNAQPICLKTNKSYIDGASIDEQSVFVYDGPKTYKTTHGSRTIRSFKAADPEFSKKYFDDLEREGKEREENKKKGGQK